jgi:hypothetical protein
MSRKSLTLALAAVVSLGVALSASSASAFHGGGAGGGAKFSGVKSSGGFQSNPHIVTGFKVGNKPMVTGIVIKPKPILGVIIKPHHHAHWPRWYWWRYTTWGRPYLAAPLVAGGVATYAATPTTNRCTCLTKDYTPQGAVVFKDVCTNEMAMNPPFTGSPAADMAPQMPQQQGYLQSQSQVQ